MSYLLTSTSVTTPAIETLVPSGRSLVDWILWIGGYSDSSAFLHLLVVISAMSFGGNIVTIVSSSRLSHLASLSLLFLIFKVDFCSICQVGQCCRQGVCCSDQSQFHSIIINWWRCTDLYTQCFFDHSFRWTTKTLFDCNVWHLQRDAQNIIRLT